MPIQKRPSLTSKSSQAQVAQAVNDSFNTTQLLQGKVNSALNDASGRLDQVEATVQSQGAEIAQAISLIPTQQLAGQGSSSGINAQGSVLPTPTGGLLYNNATANTIVWYYTGLVIYLPDNSVINVPDTSVANPSISISGLTPSTTYNFYPYYSVARKQVLWAQVAGGAGTPPAAYAAKSIVAAQLANGDGNIGLSSTTSVTAAATSGGGGGGGGGGSGCIRASMFLQTRNGMASLRTLKIGDEILGPEGWTFIEKKKTSLENTFIRFKFGEAEFLDVTPGHGLEPWREKQKLAAKLWNLEHLLKSKNGMPARIRSIERLLETDMASLITCNPFNEFFCGGATPNFTLHNHAVPVK